MDGIILDLHIWNLHSCRTGLLAVAVILDADWSWQVIGVNNSQFIFNSGKYFVTYKNAFTKK